eukprot:12772645-Ditylum_brightwellii.AAC.1
MHSQFCPARQYDEDKPDKLRVDFFVQADCRDLFIYHLDAYQGNKKANTDIDHTVRNLSTIQKAVANAIIKLGIANDPDRCRYFYMGSHYITPELFAMMTSTWNIQGVGTYKANRTGFASDELQLDKHTKQGDYIYLVDDHIGMVITRWKDSKTLQTVSTIM